MLGSLRAGRDGREPRTGRSPSPAAYRAFGLFFLGVAALIAGAFALNFDFAAHTAFRIELETARGTVVRVEPTEAYDPDAARNERTRIVAVHYTFVGPDAAVYNGVSYRPGARPTVGDTVAIEYPAGRPSISRIRGYRNAMFDRLPFVPLVPAVVGAVLLACGLTRRRDDGDGHAGRARRR